MNSFIIESEIKFELASISKKRSSNFQGFTVHTNTNILLKKMSHQGLCTSYLIS